MEPPFVIRVFECGVVAVLYIEKKHCSRRGCTLYSSLIIVISLQLHGRHIVEPRKYCLVCVIVFFFFFFACVFLYFLFLTGWEFGLIPYNWYQSLGLGLSGNNDRGSRKSVWNRKVLWHILCVLEDANLRLSLWEEIASASFGNKT